MLDRALPGWAEGPVRKPGDSSRNRAIHSQNTFRNARSSPAPAEAQRAPSSCSPPPAGASDCATLKGRKSSATSTAPCPPHCGSAIAPPRFARLTRFILFRLTAEMIESLLQAAARRERFSRRPLGFHLDFARRKTSEIPLYAGGRRESFAPAGTALTPGGRCVPHSQWAVSPQIFAPFSARGFSRPRQFCWLAECQPTEYALLSGRATVELRLRSGRAGPTSRGRAKLTFRCGSLYPTL